MRGLALAAMIAMATHLPTVQAGTRREVDWWGDKKEPENRGRRAAKRAAKVGAGTTAPDGHNA